jgi:hypothetical protein
MSLITDEEEMEGNMKYTVTQRVIKDVLVWCVVKGDEVICEGSFTACSNWAREFNQTAERLTQARIDGVGEHRKGFNFSLTQLRTAVVGSLRRAW